MLRSLAFAVALGLAAPAGAAKTEFQEVVVKPGDTLWSIAQQWLKDPREWKSIVEHNKLPTNDPTVALPGMSLRVPKSIIKEDLRSATLVQAVRQVMAREKGRPAWQDAARGRVLFNGDGLRTLAQSWARVEFFGGSLLSLDPNSMAILKSPKQSDHDLFLNRGAVHATVARVKTPSARIVPKEKDTKYTARVLDDLSTRVQVFSGAADVEDAKGLKAVEVRGGFYTDVPLDRAPAVPVKLPKVDTTLRAEIEDLGQGRVESRLRVRRSGVPPAPGDALAAQIAELSVGTPVAAYHVQIARDASFGSVLLDRRFDAYEEIDLGAVGLPDGSYWVRVAIIDLLGEKGPFSAPKQQRIGASAQAESLAFRGNLEVLVPEDATTQTRRKSFKILGRADPDLQVTINSERVPKDEDGNFSYSVELEKGENQFRIEAYDLRGNSKLERRTIVYTPP